MSKSNIEKYAEQLILSETHISEDLALLYNATSYNDWDLEDLLKKQTTDANNSINNQLEKLQLATLLSLYESNLDAEEKCNKLQEIYVEFDYPDNMYNCSIYANTDISPLQALQDLIAQLKEKYTTKQ